MNNKKNNKKNKKMVNKMVDKIAAEKWNSNFQSKTPEEYMKNKWGGPQEYPWEYIKRKTKPGYEHHTSRYNFARSRPISRYGFVQGSEVGNVEPENWEYLKKEYPVQEGAGKKKRRKTKKTKKRKTNRRKNRRRKTRRTRK